MAAFGGLEERVLPKGVCVDCGLSIEPNPLSRCVTCVRGTEDITIGIPKHGILQCCKNCGRWLQPPATWVPATLESRELMAISLRRISGLKHVKLIDASFIWTEEHSRRVKVQLTVQKEIAGGAILEQTFVVEFKVHNQMCNDCHKLMADNVWTAVVQARQKVPHKRTFYYLEQLILRHEAHVNTTSLKTHPNGLDFYFGQRNHAIKFLSFLSSVAPVRTNASERLISQDIQNNKMSYKYTFAADIAPICKGDVVVLPPKLATRHGNITPLLVCTKIGASLFFVDPDTCEDAEINNEAFWRSPFVSICRHGQLTPFIVLNIEKLGPTNGKFALAEAEVAKESDLGANDKTYFVRTHLGNILKPGDTAVGYDIEHLNVNNDNFDRLDQSNIPDVILIRKTYPGRAHKTRKRHWRLKTLRVDNIDADLPAPTKHSERRDDEDMEMFYRELEEDPEMRSEIQMYKAPDAERIYAQRVAALGAATSTADGEVDPDALAEVPEIPLEELLEGLTLNDEGTGFEDMVTDGYDGPLPAATSTADAVVTLVEDPDRDETDMTAEQARQLANQRRNLGGNGGGGSGGWAG